MKTELENAIQILSKHLIEDESYRRSWKDNIAMSFKDEYHNYKNKKDSRYLGYKDIHEVANKSAENFINILLK